MTADGKTNEQNEDTTLRKEAVGLGKIGAKQQKVIAEVEKVAVNPAQVTAKLGKITAE